MPYKQHQYEIIGTVGNATYNSRPATTSEAGCLLNRGSGYEGKGSEEETKEEDALGEHGRVCHW